MRLFNALMEIPPLICHLNETHCVQLHDIRIYLKFKENWKCFTSNLIYDDEMEEDRRN